MDHRTNRRQFRKFCWGWFLGLWWLWWWLWWLWWWLYTSNRFKSDVFRFHRRLQDIASILKKQNSMFKSTIQRLALWLAFNSFQCTSIKVVSTVICNYKSFRHALVNQLQRLLRADPCGNLVQLIDWLVGPQKLSFTYLNQFNLGHASTQSCELPKRPLYKDWTVLHCTPTEEQNHRAGNKNAQTLLASIFDIFDNLQFQPGSGCKCETMPYYSVSKLTSETTSSWKFILQ